VKITIVTLYRGRTAETYVNAVAGSLTFEQRAALTDRFDVRESEDDEDDDTLGFVEVEVGSFSSLTEVLQAFPD
jgi:predicted rRNA methylase YqxC with S4 and FtsJ domains